MTDLPLNMKRARKSYRLVPVADRTGFRAWARRYVPASAVGKLAKIVKKR